MLNWIQRKHFLISKAIVPHRRSRDHRAGRRTAAKLTARVRHVRSAAKIRIARNRKESRIIIA